MVHITASIVLYNNPSDVLKKAINSFLNSKVSLKLFLVDNSPTDELKNIKTDDRITYIHNPSNPGFGAAHNIAMKLALKNGSSYHFIVNPDVYFESDILTKMVKYMINNNDVGMLMPEILYPDGNIQNLPKLLPKPSSIVLRKIKFPKSIYQQFIDEYELRTVNSKTVYNAPVLSGCFTLIKLKAITEIGFYDDAYFMYFEDWDLSRRMHEKYKTVYFPLVSVYHEYDSGANKNYKLFKIFLKSAIYYFNKWGWLFDKKRDEINTKTVAQFKK